ncbi:hypothetical protein QBC35DRAFT_160725 [Podospora australis]|uniref:Uncharacterized protein n=1 Tax=Podospora australis TaxID=1536484 RepID=A0AAN7ALC3_9PEZI|nr:hypothetical protein QBC35DRAFT_160725 [Podospora australis]
MSSAAGGGSRKGSRKGSLGSSYASGSSDTVGSLLAAIGTCLTDALRILLYADKRQWGPDEFEQTRALEDALDEAKKDFQEMGQLVRGQFYYENDRTPESLQELRALLDQFQEHHENLKSWARQGGPINPTWARDTTSLRRELHRAQCRAARRIFVLATEQPIPRCLGAYQVYRQQKRNETERQRRQRERNELPPWQQQHEQSIEDRAARERGELPGDLRRRSSLEALVPNCNAIGRFQRVGTGSGGPEGSHDAAFVCDFCNGYIVWPDLRSMPSARTPLPSNSTSSNNAQSTSQNSNSSNNGYPHWQASGISASTGEEKTIVFAPLAIANHMAPEPGEWQAGLICPFCEEDTYLDEGEDSSEMKYVADEKGFPSVEAFREHLEWYHTALQVPPLSAITSAATSNCAVM